MAVTPEADKLANIIWNYHRLGQPVKRCDAILALGSIDTRVAERAAQLYLDGFGELLVFSGGVAHADDLLKVSWKEAEAEHFAGIAVRMGVPPAKTLIENKAQNTGQNIEFSYRLLQSRGVRVKSLLLVTKPYMERRVYATFKKQWPEAGADISITSPQIPYEHYFNETNPKDLVINLMVGDLQRVKEYPGLGFQVPQAIPDEVWQAYESLIALGYDKHLQKG